jgi:hypothetical protein
VQTSSPQIISSSLPKAHVFFNTDALTDICRPTMEPLYKSITYSDLFGPYQPPTVGTSQQQATTVWVPQDNCAYVPLFCCNCRPNWCVGLLVKAADFTQMHLINQVWISANAVTVRNVSLNNNNNDNSGGEVSSNGAANHHDVKRCLFN